MSLLGQRVRRRDNPDHVVGDVVEECPHGTIRIEFSCGRISAWLVAAEFEPAPE